MGGWMRQNRTDIIYSEVVKVVKVPRGVGLWGDMVLTMKNGSRLEIRAIPNFREVYEYINDRVTAKNPQYTSNPS